MSVFIDLVLIGLFLFFLIWFTKHGFMVTIYKIGKTWLSMFCSLVLGPWTAARLSDLFLHRSITDGIYNTLYGLVESNANDYSLGELFGNLPSAFVQFLKSFNIDFVALEAEYGATTHASEDIVYAISERIAVPCISMISGLIGHVVCFVVPLIVFTWLKLQIRKRRLAFFMYLDHVLGFVAGAAIGYCAAWGLAYVLYIAFQVVVCFDAHSVVTSVYDQTYVMKFLTEFNAIGFGQNMLGSLASRLPI